MVIVCPFCKMEMKYHSENNFYKCPNKKCKTEVWPGDIDEERGEYKKKEEKTISSPDLMLWHKEAIDYKEPLPAGAWQFGGGSKSGKRRKKKLKRDAMVSYET